MSRLKLNGTRAVPSSGGDGFHTELENGRKIDSFPKWFDKKGTVQYINCIRIHITRPGVDVDLVFPATSDMELDFSFNATDLFQFHHTRNIKRVGIFNHNTDRLLAEYIFPRVLGQSMILKQYEGFFQKNPAMLSFTYVLEAGADFGDLTPSSNHYDCNLGDETFDLN